MPKGKKTKTTDHQARYAAKHKILADIFAHNQNAPYIDLDDKKKSVFGELLILKKFKEGIEEYLIPYLERIFDAEHFKNRKDLKDFFLYRICHIEDLDAFLLNGKFDQYSQESPRALALELECFINIATKRQKEFLCESSAEKSLDFNREEDILFYNKIMPNLEHAERVAKVTDQEFYDSLRNDVLPFYFSDKALTPELLQKKLDDVLKSFFSHQAGQAEGVLLEYKAGEGSEIDLKQGILRINNFKSYIDRKMVKLMFYKAAFDDVYRNNTDRDLERGFLRKFGVHKINEMLKPYYEEFREIFRDLLPLLESSAKDVLDAEKQVRNQTAKLLENTAEDLAEEPVTLKDLAFEKSALAFLGKKGINYDSKTGLFSAESEDILTRFVDKLNLEGFATKIHKAKAKKNNPFRLEFSSTEKTAAELKEMIESLIKQEQLAIGLGEKRLTEEQEPTISVQDARPNFELVQTPQQQRAAILQTLHESCLASLYQELSDNFKKNGITYDAEQKLFTSHKTLDLPTSNLLAAGLKFEDTYQVTGGGSQEFIGITPIVQDAHAFDFDAYETALRRNYSAEIMLLPGEKAEVTTLENRSDPEKERHARIDETVEQRTMHQETKLPRPESSSLNRLLSGLAQNAGVQYDYIRSDFISRDELSLKAISAILSEAALIKEPMPARDGILSVAAAEGSEAYLAGKKLEELQQDLSARYKITKGKLIKEQQIEKLELEKEQAEQDIASVKAEIEGLLSQTAKDIELKQREQYLNQLIGQNQQINHLLNYQTQILQYYSTALQKMQQYHASCASYNPVIPISSTAAHDCTSLLQQCLDMTTGERDRLEISRNITTDSFFQTDNRTITTFLEQLSDGGQKFHFCKAVVVAVKTCFGDTEPALKILQHLDTGIGEKTLMDIYNQGQVAENLKPRTASWLTRVEQNTPDGPQIGGFY